MSNLIVIGTQWGDEGKGKIVDLLSAEADIIVRFQGGHNAGHTLVIGDQVFKLSLLPSGIIRNDKVVVIGNGVVLDPWKLLEEIDQLKSRGIVVGTDRLIISENTPLILPLHKDLDLLREQKAGREKIRIGGMVKQESIKISNEEVYFIITDLKNEINVTYSGAVPNLFSEGKGVVAEGFLKDRNYFEASKILAKHDENYMPPEVVEALGEK